MQNQPCRIRYISSALPSRFIQNSCSFFCFITVLFALSIFLNPVGTTTGHPGPLLILFFDSSNFLFFVKNGLLLVFLQKGRSSTAKGSFSALKKQLEMVLLVEYCRRGGCGLGWLLTELALRASQSRGGFWGKEYESMVIQLIVQTAIMCCSIIQRSRFLDMSLQVRLLQVETQQGGDLFSKTDPYVILRVGNEEKRSKVKQEGGEKATFNESFAFKNQDNRLRVIVMDEDTFSDDKLGEGDIDLSQYRGKPFDQQAMVVIRANGQPTGRVTLSINDASGNNQFGGNQFGGNQWGGQNQFGGNNWNQQGGQGGFGGQGNTGNVNPCWGAAEQLGRQANQ